MDGEWLIALADNVGDYFYDGNLDMAYQKATTWRFVFDTDEKMSEKSEDKLTSCYQLRN